jgi:hypothetical protein
VNRHESPQQTVVVLRNLVRVLRAAGVDVVRVDDLEQAIERIGDAKLVELYGRHR